MIPLACWSAAARLVNAWENFTWGKIPMKRTDRVVSNHIQSVVVTFTGYKSKSAELGHGGFMRNCSAGVNQYLVSFDM